MSGHSPQCDNGGVGFVQQAKQYLRSPKSILLGPNKEEYPNLVDYPFHHLVAPKATEGEHGSSCACLGCQ